MGIVGEGVEAGHEGLELAEESVQRGFGGGESVKELWNCDVGACSEVTEYALPFCRAEKEEDFLLGGVGGVFGEKAEEGLGRWVGLDVAAPGQEVAAGGDQFAGLVVSPNCRPPAAFGLQEDRTVTEEAGDEEEVEDFVDDGGFVWCHDANCAADFEVYAEFFGVICDIEVEMVGSFLCTGSGELSS